MENLILDVQTGLRSLHEYVLLRVTYDHTYAFYILKNNGILVISKNFKYFIDKQTFINEFSQFKFFLYKTLQDFDVQKELYTFTY